MLHTTLSKGKHIAQRKKERYIRAQVKGTGEFCVVKSQVTGTGKYCIEVQVKRTGRHIIRAQAQGQENIVLKSK